MATNSRVWQSSSVTHVGAVRDVNEDAILDAESQGLWVVADGMGGHEAGHIASTMLVDALQQLNNDQKLSALVEQVEDLVHQVNQDIRTHSFKHFEGRTMGSTLVSLIIRDALGACVWAGDSRLYRLRDTKLAPISVDHSRVNELLRDGLIKPEDAAEHPASNVITRAVGATQQLFLDTTIFSVEAGDIFLLCSDGLYGEVSDEEMATIIASSPCADAANNLLQRALDEGARDNVSVIVVSPCDE